MAEPLATLRAALADRYTIERELGRGGMATVYLAHDVKHARPVAVKVLRPELAVSLGPERFVREIHTAARLQHPHILALYDSGEASGFLYYVMPYLEGESLRNRLNRERQLPLDDALRIAREVADALDYAHAQGVVHRDIKPENVLFSGGGESGGGGHAMVADFGIATAISGAGDEKLTQTGFAVGTSSYMSPEQASADRAIDGRTDTYALGCVLYEMLAGHPPFLGASPQEILARHALDPVPPLRTSRPDLPPAVDRAVLKALAKAPADRFATATLFSSSLTATSPSQTFKTRGVRPAVFLAAGIAAFLAGYLLLSRGKSAGTGTPASIAVLAFDNIGGDPNNEFFSDGMSDELTTALGQVAGLSVRAHTSAFTFRGTDIKEIGTKLHVSYVLSGSVQRAGDSLRVSAKLIDATTGILKWSEQYARNAHDVFAVQDEITRAIVGQLRVQLSQAASVTIAKRSTANPEAHDLYLQGRYFFEKRDSLSLRRAQEYFERAIRTDSSYALAYSGLADTYSQRSVAGWVLPKEILPQAKAAAQRALALDSTLVEAHTSLAFLSLFLEWDWRTAEREFDKALVLAPSYPPTHLFHGWYFLVTNRMNEAVDEVREAVRLDPFSIVTNMRLATLLFYARRYRESVDQSLHVVELDPTFFHWRLELARAYVQLNRCDSALATIKGAPEQRPSTLLGVPGWAYAKCGHRAEAMSQLDHLRSADQRGQYVSHFGLAVVSAALGDKERAFSELDSAYTERAWGMFTLKVEPAFDSLRLDPRFSSLLKRVGLVQ